ncbi:MAG: tyrosine-type recombinase/integrase [Clostridium sp.]|nr:tyrosine-type recombinase/integrase [Clostridium sp.]
MKKSGKNTSIAIKDTKQLKRIQSYLKFNNYRAYVLFVIGLVTGYRGGDLVELTIADLRESIKSGELIVLENKTEHTRKHKFKRTAYLNEKLIDILKEFVRDKEDAEYVYPSKKGKGSGKYKMHIERESLGKIYKKAAIKCGITDVAVGTHTPRKTFGYIQYIKSNKDIYYVQKLFCHSSPRVTMAYIGIDDDILKESAENTEEYM